MPEVPSSLDRDARPDGPSWWYPGAPADSTSGPDTPAVASYARTMDAHAVASELQARLALLGIGHQVDFIAGSKADGVQIRSPYTDAVTVVENEGNYTLVARAGDGSAKLVDTELAVGAPVELLALYLAFHSLWSMKRMVDRHGAEAIARRLPNLMTHQQLVIAFIAGSLTSGEEGIRSYATGLLGTATSMLRG